VHNNGDFSLDCLPFRRLLVPARPSYARHEDLIIHQLKFPHDDADLEINVTFPIERLQELAAEGVAGGLTGLLVPA
jgi:hypothetical protein